MKENSNFSILSMVNSPNKSMNARWALFRMSTKTWSRATEGSTRIQVQKCLGFFGVGHLACAHNFTSFPSCPDLVRNRPDTNSWSKKRHFYVPFFSMFISHNVQHRHHQTAKQPNRIWEHLSSNQAALENPPLLIGICVFQRCSPSRNLRFQ